MIRIKNHLKFAAKSGEYNEFHSFTKTPKFGQSAEKTYPTVFAVLVSHNARGKLEKNTSCKKVKSRKKYILSSRNGHILSQ